MVDWHNGKSAMIGKSYDDALAMAGAASGVEGLATVVPIAGPYNYYDYTRSNGIVMRGNSYLVSLAQPNRCCRGGKLQELLGTEDLLAANDHG